MQETLPKCVIHCFTGTVEEVTKYLDIGCYIGLTGYLWKDQSQNGVRKALMDNLIPLDRLLIETDAPFMYPNINSAKLPENIKNCLTQDSKSYLHHCNAILGLLSAGAFHYNCFCRRRSMVATLKPQPSSYFLVCQMRI